MFTFQESPRDAALTSSSAGRAGNVFLSDGFVTIIKTVKMEKMNTIIAVSRIMIFISFTKKDENYVGSRLKFYLIIRISMPFCRNT